MKGGKKHKGKKRNSVEGEEKKEKNEKNEKNEKKEKKKRKKKGRQRMPKTLRCMPTKRRLATPRQMFKHVRKEEAFFSFSFFSSSFFNKRK